MGEPLDDIDSHVTPDGFRRRMGFLGIMGVAFTCQVYLMTLLRPVLEPFLFAIFVVMALHPLARAFESGILLMGRVICGCGGEAQIGVRLARRRDSSEEEIELTSPHDAITAGDEDATPVRGCMDEHHWHVGDQPDVETVGSQICACIARSLSVAFALAVILGGMFGFAMLIFDAAVNVKDNFPTYEQGARNAVANIKGFFGEVMGKMPGSIVDEISENALSGAKAILSDVLSEALSHAGHLLVELLMLGLYVMFWLCTPIPLNTKTERIFRRYLFLKGGACLCYGISVGLMLFILNVNLPLFFGSMSFFFSLLPEVGAFIAMVLPVPVIIFDSKLPAPFITLFIATAGQLGLKFIFANIIEVKLVEHDATMKMHPVITLLALSFFGFIWGPTGMLLSVPLMAYMKVVVLSDLVPPTYRDPVLIMLEGDRRAPERHLRRSSAPSVLEHSC